MSSEDICKKCQKKFNLFRKKVLCDGECGGKYCSNCCSKLINSSSGALKVCDKCYDIHLTNEELRPSSNDGFYTDSIETPSMEPHPSRPSSLRLSKKINIKKNENEKNDDQIIPPPPPPKSSTTSTTPNISDNVNITDLLGDKELKIKENNENKTNNNNNNNINGRPSCIKCKEAIKTSYLNMNNKIYHDNCFTCFYCNNSLNNKPFYQDPKNKDIMINENEPDQFYCEADYKLLFCPKCDGCSNSIFQEVSIQVKGPSSEPLIFHKRCFNCAHCQISLTDPSNKGFYQQDGFFYCSHDYGALFQGSCFACGFTIEPGDGIETLNKRFHRECFTCMECGVELAKLTDEGEPVKFYFENELILCQNDFRKLFDDTYEGDEDEDLEDNHDHHHDHEIKKEETEENANEDSINDSIVNENNLADDKNDDDIILPKLEDLEINERPGSRRSQKFEESRVHSVSKNLFLRLEGLFPRVTSLENGDKIIFDDYMKLQEDVNNHQENNANQEKKNNIQQDNTNNQQENNTNIPQNNTNDENILYPDSKPPTKSPRPIRNENRFPIPSTRISSIHRSEKPIFNLEIGIMETILNSNSLNQTNDVYESVVKDSDEDREQINQIISLPKAAFHSFENREHIINELKFIVPDNMISKRKRMGVHFSVAELAPDIFANIRKRVGLRNDFVKVSIKQGLISGDYDNTNDNEYFLSQDHRFIIRRLKTSELRVLRKLLIQYYEYMLYNFRETLIPLIYGVYKIKLPNESMKTYYITDYIFHGPFENRWKISEIFDLKGSTVHRFVTPKERQETNGLIILRDLNFCFRHEGTDRSGHKIHPVIGDCRKIYLGPIMRTKFLVNLWSDVRFLRNFHLMDYSLLVGVIWKTQEQMETLANNLLLNRDNIIDSDYIRKTHRTIWTRDKGGIISRGDDNLPYIRSPAFYFPTLANFLREYDFRKKMEHVYKAKIQSPFKKIDPNSLSTVDHTTYARRFFDFFENHTA